MAVTVSCRDADGIPKVDQAGEVVETEDGRPAQIMHNDVRVEADGYYGYWMTELIRLLRGHHEPQEEAVFHQVVQTLPAGAAMLELGAYWAYYSLWFQAAVPGARSFLVEPSPRNLALGQRNFALNGRSGVFRRAFVGAATGATAEGVPVVGVDDFLDEQGLAFLDLLHADVQSFEVEMLAGAERSLARHRIGHLFISTHMRVDDAGRTADTFEACRAVLDRHGYHIIASHTLRESYSGDGLIVARAPAVPGLSHVPVSRRPPAPPAPWSR